MFSGLKKLINAVEYAVISNVRIIKI
jgi:hypothetical protein